MKTVVVAGNPKPNSRTLDAGLRLAGLLGGTDPGVVDVITLGPALLGWGDEAVKSAVDLASGADLAVFASPTFKATYTGVLKLFLDQFATGDGLRGVTAVPLMLGAGPAHALLPMCSSSRCWWSSARPARRRACTRSTGPTPRTDRRKPMPGAGLRWSLPARLRAGSGGSTPRIFASESGKGHR